MRRTESLRRTVVALCGAILVALAVESTALAAWASRLPIGTPRDVSMAMTAPLDAAASALGLAGLREAALRMREQWTDPGVQTSSASSPGKPAEPSPPGPLESEGRSVDVPSKVARALPVVMPGHSPKAEELPRPAPDGATLQVVLVGDSMMAVGMAPVLVRALGKDPRFQVARLYRSGTGLSRPEVFDWMTHYRKQMGGSKADLVIAAMGANDAQNVEAARRVLKFGTPEWEALYESRLRAFLDVLTADGARVLWMAMPTMREPGFAQRMRAINAIARRVLADYPSVRWFQPSLLDSPAGAFEQYRPDARGRLLRLRADDGIHVTDSGAELLLPPVQQWLEEAVARR